MPRTRAASARSPIRWSSWSKKLAEEEPAPMIEIVSSFDDAFRRQAAENAAKQAAAESKMRADANTAQTLAARGVPVIEQMLRDFVRAVSGAGVQPKRQLLGMKDGFFSRPPSAPAGYQLHRWGIGDDGHCSFGSSLLLVTPDCRLWRYQARWTSSDETHKGYIDLSAETLGSLRINHRQVFIGNDGKPYVNNSNSDREMPPTPLQDALAEVAHGLISNR